MPSAPALLAALILIPALLALTGPPLITTAGDGYISPIAMRFGMKNTVAALGTAFTSQHAKLLSRYVDEIILCFDGDQAGENATNKAIAILKNSPLKIKVVRLNAEDDPDSYIRRNGVDAFRQQVREAQTAIEYQLIESPVPGPFRRHQKGESLQVGQTGRQKQRLPKRLGSGDVQRYIGGREQRGVPLAFFPPHGKQVRE